MALNFTLPHIQDNADGSWGPSTSALPAQFKDIPYAPFSKSDKITRVADWHDLPADAQGGRQRQGQPRRQGREAYGAAEGTVFGFVHDEDEKSFSLVDSGARTTNRTKGPIRAVRQLRGNAPARGGRGRGGGRGGFGGRGRGGARGGYGDWNKPQRTRDSSVTISPDWQVLEEIDFTRLAKLNLSVSEAEDLASYGTVQAYDRAFDRINTRNEKPLEILDRVRYNTSTSDDPVIAQLAEKKAAQIFATDSILSVLMTSPRSVNSWDIIFERKGDQLFLDKRESGPFDYITVNENAAEAPLDSDDQSNINSAGSLSLEATYINQNFSSQVIDAKSKSVTPKPNPFYSADIETEPLASTLYKYRKFDLSIEEDETFDLIVRTEADAYLGKKDTLITVKALNEFDPRAQGGSGKPLDWRKNLDTQKGAIVASEMKNNSAKLARWAVQSILVGAEYMKMGYISRANSKDAQRHVIVGVQSFKPNDFARQMNVSLTNGWGIVRTIADLLLKQPEGKYVLVKDPNSPQIKLYKVPDDAFDAADDGETIAESQIDEE
ncbi:eukaryotic translation initiation factor 3 subunit D [Kwoniella dejecticola CBS 10117]|uniref:Eukaryotic translation initiation factor 3 subunit D n=1 Tax=Kwoniella dejecticola CBS 10117 TaxID=1296121 RepID=A0A1A6A7W9_9TREE|nr:eukaryotic translation initiation factor 3 subunit D [Kwoniella dejecticola CBS 10117]OBR86151.1 eukaryotic translation initiation factor 3 subunit D [Kwoniella dejecticola CBS 10117]